MTGFRGAWRRGAALLRHAAVAALLWLAASALAHAQDKAQLIATEEAGFGRIVVSFPGRMALPQYTIKFDNGVLAIEFGEQVALVMPDLAVTLPDYATVGRADPDNRGVRIGLRTAFNINHMEAGEKLFIDLLPANWQGLPPGLPQSVVDDLALRARQNADAAEQQRKIDAAKALKPVATVRVGRNPTFVRVQFDWNVDAEAKYSNFADTGVIDFDWPVPIDLYPIKADLPKELLGIDNAVSTTGSRITVKAAQGVKPRFYQITPTQFVLDIDTSPEEGLQAALAADDAAKKAEQDLADARAAEAAAAQPGAVPAEPVSINGSPTVIVPQVTSVNGTVRITFPFEEDTAAAVFERGETVWMLFDSDQGISAPPASEELASIASHVAVIPFGDTKVLRLDLSTDRLATLGAEGRSWVLSLGDVILNPTEPLSLARHRDDDGQFEISADLARPHKVHDFHDPDVGDTLEVVTVFPPARGLSRNLDYVDFDALRSVHGLVVKPVNETLKITVGDKDAVITADGGLTLSARETMRVLDSGNADALRGSFLDIAADREDDPGKLDKVREALMTRAAAAEDGSTKDTARLDLARFYVANGYSYEAIGVLKVLEGDLKSETLRKKVQLTRAVADTLAGRYSDALGILNGDSFQDEVDAVMWRSIAKSGVGDFKGARLDAIAAEEVSDAYPAWVRAQYLFSALRAAVETKDEPLATRIIGKLEVAHLDPEQLTTYHLMQGRIAELDGRDSEALDSYGQVVAADVRPTRAEAVYRTLLILSRTGKIDLDKATRTLSAEAMMWRGNPLEADMDRLLAELYFRHGDYREGFEAVKQAVAFYPDNPAITALLAEAQTAFEDLYLNGEADSLPDVDALSLYYDFRQLTPPGARGDEMIRNLARRLVKADLLGQAGDLLEYQIDSRLKGVAQAQVAADLAVIRIANRDPEGALRVLNHTRLADLPPTLERQRRILEARALIDAGRQELAIDLISRLDGRDADMLRVDGFWKTKNYDDAAAILEVMYAPQPDLQMTTAERLGVVKAAVGFVLADDKLGISRLRSKFADQMANSEQWPIFDFLTREIAPQSVEFRKVASEVSGMDSLEAFLGAYGKLYASGDGMNPTTPAPPKAG